MRLNEDVMVASGGSWNRPPATTTWNQEQATRRDKMIDVFMTSSKLWGFKDPRTLFTLPFWQEGLTNIKYAGTFRHPALVARSLSARNAMPADEALGLWQRYNVRLLEYLDRYDFPIVSFDVSSDEYLRTVDQIAHRLDITNEQAHIRKPFFTDQLRGQAATGDHDAVPDEITRTYEKLCRIYRQQLRS